jgi:hypothetical protein
MRGFDVFCADEVALVRWILSILNADVLKSLPYAKPGDCTENDSVYSVPRPSLLIQRWEDMPALSIS